MLNNIQAYLKSKNIDPNELSQGIQLGGMALNPSLNTTGIGNIALGAGAALSLIPGALIPGTALSAAGVLTNTLFGSNVNKSAVLSIQQQNSDIANLQADTSSNQSILDLFNGLQLLDNINKKDIGTEGLFSNKVSNIAKKLNTQRDLANMQAINNLNNGALTVLKQNDLMALQNYAAYGGNLNNNLFENGGQINHSYKTNSFIRNKIREFEGSSMKTNDSFISQERKFNKITPNLDKLTDNQKHALFSYMYNAPKAYINKTLPLIQLLSDSPSNELYKQIGDSILQGQNSSLKGLKTRREWERNLFNKDLINQTDNQTNNQNNNETSFINNTINSNQFEKSNINELVAQPLYNNNYISANELLSYVAPTQKSQLQTPLFSSVYNNQYLNNTFSKGGNLNLMKNKSNNKNEKGQSFSELLKDKSNFIRSNALLSINNKELLYASGGDINRLNGFMSTIYADGGYTQNQLQPDYSDLLDRVNKSNADFINRLKDPNRQTIKLAKGRVATHKMSWADDGNGNAIIYPEVQNINGKLVDLSGNRQKAFESAVLNGDTIHMTPSEANWFTNNYKKYYPGFDEYAMGGGLSRSKNYESSKEPYPSVKSKDFAGGGRSYPIPTKCLSGDTKIALLTGEDVRIKDIVDKEVWVYSYDSDKRVIVPAIATNIHCTFKNAEIYLIKLDNGEIIECTYNHPFLLRDGMTYVIANELKNGDSLMPLYRRQRSMYKKDTEGTKATYEEIKQPFYDFWEYTHRMVWRELNNQVIPDKYHIHHIDGNAHNNTPSNIKCCSQQEHAKIHAANRSIVGERDYNSYRWDGENARFKASERMRRENKLRIESGQMEEIGKKISEVKKQRNFAKIKYEIEEAYKLYLSGYTLQQLKDWWHVSDIKVVKNRFKRAGYILRNNTLFNHKVVSVEKAPYTKDVYDLTVSKYHNFALSSGVFVHNSDAIDALRLAGMHNRPDVRAKVYKKYPELKHDLGGPLFDYGGNLYTNLPNENQHGGYFDDGLMEINEGGTHELNPYHGVQLGLNSQGKLNLVEQGETVFDDYVFSNRILPSKTLLQENLLPTSGSTFASISKSLSRESKERPNDPISNNGLNVSMQRLKNAQEEAKQSQDIKDRYLLAISGIYDNSDENINPDLYNILNSDQGLDLLLEQQELQEDNQQLYARGGVKSKLKYLDTIPWDSYIVSNNYKPNFELKLKNMNIPIILNKQNQLNPLNTLKFKDNTFLRYAPVLGSLAATFGDMAGITNRPNYSNANAMQSATLNIPNVNFTPIGQRLKYNPMDTNLYMNQAQALNNASLDAIKENSLGNSAAANAAILANNYNYQNNLGNFGLQALQYNDKLKQLVTDFNRQTDEFNSEGALKAESANLSKSNLLLDSAFKLAAMKQLIYDNSQNARMANLNNLLQSLGDIGNENELKNWLNALSQSNVFGTLNPVMLAAMNGKTTFKKGGKLKTIKKKGLLF